MAWKVEIEDVVPFGVELGRAGVADRLPFLLGRLT
jgi:hypothetical protein